jgi:hypothetical protein
MAHGETEVVERVATTLEYPEPDRARVRKIAAAQRRSVNAQLNVIVAEYLACHDDTGAPNA